VRDLFAPIIDQQITPVVVNGVTHYTQSVENFASNACAVYWQNYYIISIGSSPTQTNPYTFFFNTKTGAWTGCDFIQAADFLVSEGAVPGATSGGFGDLLWVNSQLAAQQIWTASGDVTPPYYPLYRMQNDIANVTSKLRTLDKFAGDTTGTEGVPWEVVWRAITPEELRPLVGRINVQTVTVMAEVGTADVDLTLILYDFGVDPEEEVESPLPGAAPPGIVLQSTLYMQGAANDRMYRLCQWTGLSTACRYPVIGLIGTAKSDFVLQLVEVEMETVQSADIPTNYLPDG
jgi:hypothetical protein